MTAQVLSVHTGHRSDFGKSIDTQYPQKMDTSVAEPPTPSSPDQEESRGRRRDRDDMDGETNGEGDGDGDATGSSRKRRRSRKGLDKKFNCPHDGCGKSYSRAEHLYRHQLNRKSALHGILARSDDSGLLDAQVSVSRVFLARPVLSSSTQH